MARAPPKSRLTSPARAPAPEGRSFITPPEDFPPGSVTPPTDAAFFQPDRADRELLDGTGLVQRGEGADRRSRPLRLTAGGDSAARAVLRKRRAAVDGALRALTPLEQRTLARLAGKVLTAIVRDEAQALAVCRVCDYDACPDSDCPVARALAP